MAALKQGKISRGNLNLKDEKEWMLSISEWMKSVKFLHIDQNENMRPDWNH